ncbi:MAG: ATP-binding protein [Bdellovibrio sp.]
MVRSSLFGRMLLPLLIALSVCWIIFVFILGRASYKELYEVLDAQMIQTAQMLSVPMDYGKLPQLRISENVKESEDNDDYQIHFSVWDNNENILYADKRGDVLPSSFEQNGFSKVKSDSSEYRVYTYHNRLTGLSASAGYPASVKTKILQEVIEKFWLPWLIGLFALVFVLFLSLWWGFQPLYRLQREIKQRDPNHLEKFITEVPFELNKLKAELNRLIEKIRLQMDKERRFIADAAHELKTPLTAIRVQTEILQMDSEGTAQKTQSNKIIQAVDRTNHLVDQLLTLSRLDEKDHLQDKKILSLDEIFKTEINGLMVLIDQKKAQVAVLSKERFEIKGDQILMGILFKNLIENALKYSSDGVKIAFDMNSMEFSVADNGPGLPKEVLQRIGERFYRPEGQSETGTGLGLSIVMKIAELHNLQMTLENLKDGGLKVKFSKKTLS